MDRKVGAALAVGIIGVIVGAIGIVMAKDASDSNKDTQAQLEQQIRQNDRSSAARVAAAAAAAKLIEQRAQGNAAAAEQQDQQSLKNAEQKGSAQVSANAAEIKSLNEKVDQLSAELAGAEGRQKSGIAKLNDRIDQLAGRAAGG